MCSPTQVKQNRAGEGQHAKLRVDKGKKMASRYTVYTVDTEEAQNANMFLDLKVMNGVFCYWVKAVIHLQENSLEGYLIPFWWKMSIKMHYKVFLQNTFSYKTTRKNWNRPSENCSWIYITSCHTRWIKWSRLRFHQFVGWLVGLSTGNHKNYWMDFNETWMEDGSQPIIDHVWIKRQIQELVLTFFNI